ncbi:MAG TPA: hypothetical protein VHT05_03660 [Candidatus Elarobacter sp.]|jgi:hypothetical protein|nr:hypothetical protein [Candidatus Elarobacter sp.]
MRTLSACIVPVLVVACAAAAAALPGNSFSAEKARLAKVATLRPLTPVEGVTGRWSTHPLTGGDETQGEDGWAVTVVAANGTVSRESLDVKAFGKPYAIAKDGATTFASVFGPPVETDFAGSTVVATQHEGPQITQTFRRGARYAYRSVDDARNGLHTLEFFSVAALPNVLRQYAVTGTVPSAGSGSDAIFVVQGNGALAPVAVQSGMTLIAPNDGRQKLDTSSKVNLIFGDRTVETVPVTVINGSATVPVPASMHLGGYVGALASPTLGGAGATPRRAPTPAERAAVLTAAAARLGTDPGELTVRNLTAIDLGHGPALVGTLNWKGTGTPRIDRRIFFVNEDAGGKRAMTLWNVQTITVTDPLLEEPAEYLVDALDLGKGKIGLVTHIVGYDADTYTVYTRTGTAWKSAYAGGGVAL